MFLIAFAGVAGTNSGVWLGAKFGHIRWMLWPSILIGLISAAVFAEAFSERMCATVCDPCLGGAEFGAPYGPALWPNWIKWASAASLAVCFAFATGRASGRFALVAGAFVVASVIATTVLVSWIFLSSCPLEVV
jgi:hypothetical protein